MMFQLEGLADIRVVTREVQRQYGSGQRRGLGLCRFRSESFISSELAMMALLIERAFTLVYK